MNVSIAAARADLNLFRIFQSVYRAGSLTQAAAQLHLTQPAVSNALARLRLQLGDVLFVRDGRRMAPTPRARQIAPQVDAALASLDEALLGAGRFDPRIAQRRYTIGMRDMLEFLLLPPLLCDLRNEAPRLSLVSARIERRRMPRMLASGALDLAIDVRAPQGEDVRQQLLMREELVVALRSQHPLAKGRLKLADWLQLPHVVVSARASGPVLEDPVLQERGLQREVAVRCQHYYAACRLIAETDLTMLLPRGYAERFGGGLKLLKPPLPIPALELSLYWHRNAENDGGLIWLRDRILSMGRDRFAMPVQRKMPRAQLTR